MDIAEDVKGEWQDIATAPRDGKEVQLLTFYYYPGDKSPTVGWWVGSWDHALNCWDVGDEFYRDDQLWKWAPPDWPPFPPKPEGARGFVFPSDFTSTIRSGAATA